MIVNRMPRPPTDQMRTPMRHVAPAKSEGPTRDVPRHSPWPGLKGWALQTLNHVHSALAIAPKVKPAHTRALGVRDSMRLQRAQARRRGRPDRYPSLVSQQPRSKRFLYFLDTSCCVDT